MFLFLLVFIFCKNNKKIRKDEIYSVKNIKYSIWLGSKQIHRHHPASYSFIIKHLRNVKSWTFVEVSCNFILSL